MEVYRTEDNHVAKYIHDDGSETAIKTTPLVTFGGTYGKVTNKFNVFISASVGCPIGCKFCYLTTKKCPYHKLSAKEITKNVYQALAAEVTHKPQLKTMYAKLSWMGMGDAILDMEDVIQTTLAIEAIIRNMNLAKGIDGVDIATTMPIIPKESFDYVKELNTLVSRFDLNPRRNYDTNDKSPVRLFYSLHSAEEMTRNNLIPVSLPIDKAVTYLGRVRSFGITTILHHMFFDGINDSIEEVGSLIRLLQTDELKDIELRLLRFNKCEGTSYKESSKFNHLVDRVYTYHKNIKVQSSPGSEVKAACGQFLLSKIGEASSSKIGNK